MEKQRILLVDDSPKLLKLGKAIFESGGYDVLTATDGVEALDILLSHTVELVITDILMPNMDGYSLCYNIRNNEKSKDIPIIVYSATYLSQSDEALALEIGADLFIRKPAAMNFLHSSARNLIANPRKHNPIINNRHELSDVTRKYNFRLIEKLEQKNEELEKSQAELIKSESRFRALVENGGDAVVILSEIGKPTYVSPSIERVLGYTEEEAMKMDLFSVMHPDDITDVQKTMAQAIANPGIPIKGHTGRMMHKDGTWHWYEATVTNLLHDPAIGGIVDNFRDVTGRKKAEEKIKKTNRLYTFISQINQTIVHSEDEQTVFRKACWIATEFGKFNMAWIGIIDAANKKISLVESGNISSEDIPLFTNASYDHGGPVTQVLRTGESYICNDVENEIDLPGWKQYGAARGLHSIMVLPIRKTGVIIGTFNLYSSEKQLFDEQEIALLEEAAGDISFALGVFEKEKHRKEMEEKVTHSESSLKIAQSIGHLGSWENDFFTGLTLWSDEHCRIFGLSINENIQTYESWISYMHPDDLEYVLKMISEGYDSLKTSIYDHRIILKNGSVKFIHTETHFKFSSDGKPIGIYGIALDVTVQKESEKALALSEANMRLFMNLIPQAIFVKDYYGNFIFTNKSFAELYGRTPEQLINKTLTDTIPIKADAEIYLQQDREIILSGQTKTIPEQNFTDYRGNKRILHTIKVPYTVAGTNGKAVLGITMDITDDKIAETERLKMMADIVQRNQDLEQFSYIISHNLRAPVANILGLVDVMQAAGMDKNEEETVIEYLTIAAKNLDNVIMDLNSILELKHAVGEKKEIVKFEELVNEIRISLGSAIFDEKASIICNFTAINDMITLRSYLHSIFYNLISNSIKYRRQGIYPLIEITTYVINDKIQILFKDNGLGIDLKKNSTYLFGLYKRFHTHVDGKGMGLYMVKTQVESLGGKITVKSEVNKGTTFIIEFDIN